MKRFLLIAAVAAMPIAARAQTPTQPAACRFDTAAHTDTLKLEFSLRAYRGDDTIPDFQLTLNLGDMFAAHLHLPPTVGDLFAPNAYVPAKYPNGYTTVFGSMQFELTAEGKVNNLKLIAPSLDPATNTAIDAAMQAAIAAGEPRNVATGVGLKKNQKVRLQFLATQDPATHAPLALMKVPMIRADSGPSRLGSTARTQAVLVPRDMVVVDPPSFFEYTVDETGHVNRESAQIVYAFSLDAAKRSLNYLTTIVWRPAFSGGCPIGVRVRSGDDVLARVKQ